MSKAVLISIQPRWCDLIAIGKKKVELRKSRPKIETPFKVYIYCTQDKYVRFANRNNWSGNGKVIGEFICNEISTTATKYGVYLINEQTTVGLTAREVCEYGNGKQVYFWHIFDLLIYDEPKELCEFYGWTDYDDSKKDKRPCSYCEHSAFDYSENCEYCSIDYDGEHCVHLQMKRPPQSWCYVEELK